MFALATSTTLKTDPEPRKPIDVGLGKYLKKAFLQHWNLLAFLGGTGFALLSGHPDVFVPLVLAGEVTYLGMLGTHPKFQRYVDAQEAKAGREQGSALAAAAFEGMMKSLPPRQLKRFRTLRESCVSLRHIAEQMRASEEPAGGTDPLALQDLQLSGLDRLLWIYLRLLYTQHMLDRFFENTSQEQIEAEIQRLEDRLARSPATEAADTSPRRVIRKALEDNLETCRARLANLHKARENSELVEAEIERLDNKIRSITEMAINRQDPQFVSGQVDQVAESLIHTEETMNELRFATGLDATDDAAPYIIPRSVTGEAGVPVAENTGQPSPRAREREDGIQFF
jgi:hypothetical protein